MAADLVVLQLRGVGLSDTAVSSGVMALFTTIVALGLMALSLQTLDVRATNTPSSIQL